MKELPNTNVQKEEQPKTSTSELEVIVLEDPKASEVLMTEALRQRGETSTFNTLSGAEYVPGLNLI